MNSITAIHAVRHVWADLGTGSKPDRPAQDMNSAQQKQQQREPVPHLRPTIQDKIDICEALLRIRHP